MEIIPNDIFADDLYETITQHKEHNKVKRLTSFIVTFQDVSVTSIDILNLMELGLHIVRFKMSHTSKADKVYLLNLLNEAENLFCEKYGESHLPITVSIDIPNCLIKTGVLKEDLMSMNIKQNSTITLTSDSFYSDKCDDNIIFIDDPYMIKTLTVGMEITIKFGEIIMFCTEVVNDENVLCSVHKGGELGSIDAVCIRGVTHRKPPLTKRDLNLIEFAKEYGVNMIMIHSIRYPATLRRIKKLLSGHPILIFATICEKEGLDNIEEIIHLADGIVIAREYLCHELINPTILSSIQLSICAKCQKKGKPVYISGQILEQTLKDGTVSILDVSDVTNAILQGAGFVLRDYEEPLFLLKTLKTLDNLCKFIEPLCKQFDFWRLHLEFPLPVNAAEGCVLGCALAALKIGAKIIIIPSVSGHTVTQLVRLVPTLLIVGVTRNIPVAKRLRIYNCILPIIYDQKRKNTFNEEMQARVEFAILTCQKHNYTENGHTYVVLQRSVASSAYCDMIRFDVV